MLSLEYLKKLLSYEPGTGVFTWLVNKGRIRKGTQAGTMRKDGYRLIMIDHKLYYAHRLAIFYMTGEYPTSVIDHKDQNPINNKYDNLRLFDRSRNAVNGKVRRKNNSSGHRGVYWHNQNNNWCVQITINKKTKHLGCFDKLEDAIDAYQKKAKEYVLRAPIV